VRGWGDKEGEKGEGVSETVWTKKGEEGSSKRKGVKGRGVITGGEG